MHLSRHYYHKSVINTTQFEFQDGEIQVIVSVMVLAFQFILKDLLFTSCLRSPVSLYLINPCGFLPGVFPHWMSVHLLFHCSVCFLHPQLVFLLSSWFVLSLVSCFCCLTFVIWIQLDSQSSSFVSPTCLPLKP